MSTKAELTAERTAVVMKFSACLQKIEGAKRLFQAAALVNDGVEADKQRQMIHALLDEELDHTARLCQIAWLLSSDCS